MHLDNPIATGGSAKIYFHKGKIIKIFEDSPSLAEAEFEASKQRYALSLGLPVPKVHEVANVNGKPAIIMDFVNGKTVGNMVYNDISMIEKYMNLSVDIQLKMHSIKTDAFEPMREKLTRQIRSAVRLNEKEKSLLLKKLSTMKFDKMLCHGDFHMFNLIDGGDDNVTIIDWVDASAGSPSADVYRSYLLYLHYSEFWADLYLRIYCAKSGMSQEEIFAWEPVIAAARLSEHIATDKEPWLSEIVNKFCQTYK